jgi:hypothetical protein
MSIWKTGKINHRIVRNGMDKIINEWFVNHFSFDEKQ